MGYVCGIPKNICVGTYSGLPCTLPLVRFPVDPPGVQMHDLSPMVSKEGYDRFYNGKKSVPVELEYITPIKR